MTIKGANVTMLGGTINNASGNGVTLSSGTFTLGVEDYPVSQVAPAITASGIGVNRTGGTFNFYDGKITGSSKAISGVVADTPELYSVQLNEGETVATLGINATFEQVALMNGTYYDSLQSAISSAGNNVSTIQLAKDVVLTNSVQIEQLQNITLDLAGYSIKIANSDYTLINNGTLTIIDSTSTLESVGVVSCIQNLTGSAIQNNGTLTIGNNDGTVYTNMPTIIGAVFGIENNGFLNIFDGNVKGKTSPLGGTETVLNVPEGYIVQTTEEVVNEESFKVLNLTLNE